MSDFSPYIVELTDEFDSVTAFRRLASREHCVFLDSARRSDELGRYSFLSCDPFRVVRSDAAMGSAQDSAPLDELERYLSELPLTQPVPGLPPFQGGAMGLWSYDLVRSIEQIPVTQVDEFSTPAMSVGLYDVVLGFDHVEKRCWLVSQGLPETDVARRTVRARSRADQFLSWLRASPNETPSPSTSDAMGEEQLGEEELGPLFKTNRAGVFSNFESQHYRETVQRVIDYIHAGDAFQVNLAQRLLCRAHLDSVSLYLKLREKNAAPFAGYYDLGTHQIISASPERFLSMRERLVETRPIKGTRQRSPMPEADLFSGAELQASRKDVSENVMIVDLMRNDLSRVCDDDSIVVTKLCGLELYEHVQHLVSVVQGRLSDAYSPVDLIRATFPGGSITGAPKIRAMEIIAELEPTARGAYCGSLGYVGFDGAMDLSILIRTITANRGWWQFPVGGGIVANSNPQAELEETWHKAEGMLKAIL